MLDALFALLLLGAAAPPAGPSFACTGTLSPTEQAICGDPELAAWDRAQAMVYRALDRKWELSVETQRAWLTRRDTCGTNRTCLLTAYREWPGFDEVAHNLGPSFERIGTGRRDPAYLDVMPIYGGWYYFTLVALHQQTPDPASTNMGVYGGLIDLKNGVGTYSDGPEDYACRFQISQSRRSGWLIEEIGENTQCGGLNVFVSGEYRSVKRRRK